MLITTFPLIFFILSYAAFFNVIGVAGEGKSNVQRMAEGSPLTAKAAAVRYWKKQISNDLPKPWFLLNKASPLDAVQLAKFSKLAGDNTLSTQLPAFCSKANLLCFPDVSTSLAKHDKDVNFANYDFTNFTNYGENRGGGTDSFKNYADGENTPLDNFRRYSHDSAGHNDKFSSYGTNANDVFEQKFTTYGTSATGGSGDFSKYNINANDPGVTFKSYSNDANGRQQGFSRYTTNANFGNDSFTSYGKNGNGAINEFKSYANGSNVITSTFANYAENGNGPNDTFTSYGSNGNTPVNDFRNYGAGGNAGVQTFKRYSDGSAAGDDSFQSYEKGSNAPDVSFTKYGQSIRIGTDKFTGYGENADHHTVAFATYASENTFKEYSKDGVTFSNYINRTDSSINALLPASQKTTNNWVEAGKFFREQNLKTGNIMPMPDIRDKMPKRSFLPRLILSKLPFSSIKIPELHQIFKIDEDSTMAGKIKGTLNDCERAPSKGETKRCVASVEDMVDFSTSVLGRNIVVRTTENTVGSKGNILIGSVKGINGGKITQSVSCHQSMFPFLIYYCHSVPKVRVYEADILDPKSKEKINHGVAICHIDTSSWSPTHGAFLALGSGPGKIEVCHWIFENDMTWTTAD